MITGYILSRVKVPPKVPFALNILLWMLSLSILSSIIFGVAGGELSVLVTSFYVSLGHAGNIFKTQKGETLRYEHFRLGILFDVDHFIVLLEAC